MSVVALLSDFGLEDHYVAAMKGEVLRRAPNCRLLDITHFVPPQDIARGAYELSCVGRSLPQGTIVLGVIDPGVGSLRRGLAVSLTNGRLRLVGPDNGLFGAMVQEDGGLRHGDWVELHSAQEAVTLDPGRLGTTLSATFHGRDLFGPVAGALAAGKPLAEFGDRIGAIRALSSADDDRIIAIDRFGNLITSVRPEAGRDYTVVLGGRRIVGLRRTYSDGLGLILVTSSSGYLEIAMTNGSAARELNARPGDRVIVETLGVEDD